MSGFQTLKNTCPFPPEIIEHILYHCHHKTITVIKTINKEWRQIADYVIKKRCNKEIQKGELLQYRTKWKENGISLQWDHLYDNWENWKNLAKNIHFEVILFIKQEHIKTICAYGNILALGVSSDVMLFDIDGNITKQFSNLYEEDDVTFIHFIGASSKDKQYPAELLIAYPEKVLLTDLSNGCIPLGEYQFERTFSAYDQYFSCISRDKHLEIVKIANKTFQVMHRIPIDVATNEDVDLFLSQDCCMVMVENKIKIIKFQENNSNINIVNLAPLEFAINYMTILGRHHTWIFQDNIVIVTYYATRSDDHHLEIFLLDSGNPPSFLKSFISWGIFGEEVNFVHFYGNTLILVFMSGWFYFYEVTDWNLLELSRYSMRLQLPRRLGPIKKIDVTEKHGQRIFYIADCMTVHKVTGTFV